MRLPLLQTLALLRTYLRPHRRWVAVLAVLVLTTIGLRLAGPQVLRAFIDAAMAASPHALLVRLALLFFGIALVTQGLAVVATYVGETVAWSATNDLRLDLLRHALHLDAAFHQEHTPGQLIERIDGDVATLSNFFSRFVIDVVGNGLLVLGILTLLFREDWRIGLPIFGFASLTIVVLVRIRRAAIPHWTAFRKLNAEMMGLLGEQLGGTEDIRANGAVAFVLRRFAEFCRRLFPVRLRSGLAGYAMWMSNIALFTVGHAVAFGVGAMLWKAAAISLGTAYLIFHYTELLRGPISEIRTQITDLQRAEAGIRRIRTLTETRSALADHGTAALPDGALPVHFEDVHFAYRAAPADGDTEAPTQRIPALHDITFRLESGEVLGLLGRTGSGKSTLARLLVRLYDSDSGAVRVADVPVADVPLARLRRAIRMVPQEVQLFRATLRDNVRLFDPQVTDKRILRALDDLGIREWALRLPRGLDTVFAAGGGDLSAGQAQLISLARAFLADPGVLILDEASSRLDPATEALLERAMDRLLAGRTAIVIAHRLSTVQRADRVLILEDGRIAELGRREELEADGNSHLHRLLLMGMEEVLV